jgi:hypothetical protein
MLDQDDSMSPKYIFEELSKIDNKRLFRKDDYCDWEKPISLLNV